MKGKERFQKYPLARAQDHCVFIMRHVTTDKLGVSRRPFTKKIYGPLELFQLDPVLAGFLHLIPVWRRLGSARLVFDLPAVPVWLSLRRPRSSLRSFHVSYSTSIATTTRWPPRRAFSIIAHLRSDLFEYTSGWWM